MEILNALMVLAAESAEGLKFIAIGLAALSMAGSAIGEGLVVAKAMEGMSRNPEMYGKLRTGMILGCSLVETTAIYALLIAILLLFVA
ncbi:MAG: ATP synthase F0 subunit C [Candidatus Onthovivens sp.]|nr:ATP synthase F0 subunit C [Candidatus Onthovivens sp.]